METCSHLIEIKKIMGKCLVCDIQVQDISIATTGIKIQTNKWLHLENWLEIDAEIQRILDPFKTSKTFDDLKPSFFHLDGAIRVDCKKKNMSGAYKRIFGDDKKYFPIALEIRVSKVDTKALMKQINEFQEKLNRSLKKEDDKNLIHKENLREYDPTSIVGIDQTSNDYVPYTASVKTPSKSDTSGSALSENEPYSPKPISITESSPDQISESPNDVPNYKPARIAHNSKKRIPDESSEPSDSQKEEKKRSKKLCLRPSADDESKNKSGESSSHEKKLGSNRKVKSKNAELFGSDDSDQEKFKSPTPQSPKRLATTLHPPSTSENTHKDSKNKRLKLRQEFSLQKSPLDGWLSKGSIKSNDNKSEKSNGKTSKKSLRHQTKTDTKLEIPKKLTEEQLKNQNLLELQQIKELSALRDTLKAKRKSPPPVMEILSLMHLSTEQIFATFEEVRPILDEIFKTYSKKTKITGYEGINHLKTLILIDDKKQLKMMNFLRENYQPEEKGVPKLTELYINALVPEWTINVFMKEFNFTRLEAIERLQAQEDSTVHHNNDSSLDLSGPL